MSFEYAPDSLFNRDPQTGLRLFPAQDPALQDLTDPAVLERLAEWSHYSARNGWAFQGEHWKKITLAQRAAVWEWHRSHMTPEEQAFWDRHISGSNVSEDATEDTAHG